MVKSVTNVMTFNILTINLREYSMKKPGQELEFPGRGY